MDKKRIIKDFFILSGGNYISQGLGMVSGFLLRVFLEPYYMGIWQGLNIIKSYSSYTNLGVSRSAAREIAYFRGKGDVSRAEILKNTGFYFSILTVSLVGLGCILFSLVRKNHLNPYIFWGLITIGIIIILERIESYIVVILRSKKMFFPESFVKVFNSTLNILLVITIVKNFKLFGLYASNVSIFLISIFCIIYISKETFRFVFNPKELKHLIKIGIPLALLGFMFVNLTNIDRIITLKMLGAKSLGLYSIAIMFGNAIYNISNMAGIVIYPRFQEKYGKTNSKKEVHKIAKKLTKLILLPYLLLIILCIFLFPFLIKIFIPKYIGGIKAMKIFLIGIFFLSLSIPYNHFLVTINKQFKLLGISVIIIGINAVLNIFLIKQGFGIEGVAIATSMAYFLYFIMLFIESYLTINGRYT